MQQSALTPTSESELVEAIAGAIAENAPLDVIGAGTKRDVGRPVQAAATLSLAGFSGIIAYEPEELVLTAGAGTLLADIEAALEARGQCFAFEPPDFSRLLSSAHSGTLGGLLATNLSGPRRLKSGAARDHVLGIAGVSGRGGTFKAGGRVVKNVTGYDLPKLMANSWGTLAALTSITFKVAPKPETEETLVLSGRSDADAVSAMSRAMRSPCEVSGAAHLPEGLGSPLGFDRAATFLRLEGIPASVAYRRDALSKLLGAAGIDLLAESDSAKLWRSIRDVLPFAEDKGSYVWRLSVAPSEAPRLAATIGKVMAARAFYDWAGGLVWLETRSGRDGGAALIRAGIREGHATLIRAPQQLRASAPGFHPQPPALAELSKRVKTAFDPAGVLNPGRMYQGW